MTINVSFSTPGHCGARVTVIANPREEKPTETFQDYGPGQSVSLVVHTGQSLRIDETDVAPAPSPDVDSVAADQSAQARGGEAPTPEAEEAERRAEQEQDDTFDDDEDDSDGDDEDEDDDLK